MDAVLERAPHHVVLESRAARAERDLFDIDVPRKDDGEMPGGHALDKQIDTTVKLLLALITEPRLTADKLAKMLDVSPNYIAKMLVRYRDAGIHIEYDFSQKKYVGKFSEQLERTILGPFAKKLKRAVARAEFSQPKVRFVHTLESYTVQQFAELMKVSDTNIYNGLNGYKGQQFPAGYVAYKTGKRTSWIIVKAETDRTGTKYRVPKSVLDIAYRYVIGSESALPPKAKSSKCNVVGCQNHVQARGLCGTHYQEARRHPERYDDIVEPE